MTNRSTEFVAVEDAASEVEDVDTSSVQPIRADDTSADSASRSVDEASEEPTPKAPTRAAQPRSIWRSTRLTVAAGVVLVLLLGSLTAWQGWLTYQTHRQQEMDEALLRAARQGVLNLTTIDYNKVDSDVARVLDSSTGSFRDDFQQRAQPFAEVVKQAKSVSVGSITEAALESSSATQGQALVAVSVKTSDASGAEQQPRMWRMRVAVDQTDQGIKISNVEFVP